MLHSVAERWTNGNSSRRFVVAVGTRPEAIKLAPVITELRRRALEAGRPDPVFVCATGQHDGMVREALGSCGIRVDANLALMTPGQSLAALSARVLTGFEAVLNEQRPEWVIVQGDTATTAMAGLAAFYAGIKVAHVEAGLRTNDLQHPFPEEFNRRMVGIFADIHFAATPAARQNLLREGVPPAQIVVTGNTGIDALHGHARRLGLPVLEGHRTSGLAATASGLEGRPVRVLITAHRRENLRHGIENLCLAINDLARHHPGRYHFVWPLHPNPLVGDQARRQLERTPGVTLMPAANYEQLLGLLAQCDMVLTDSGGIQEEAPSFGKPVLILRETTERPEGVDAGIASLVGSDPTRIVHGVERLTRRIEQGIATVGENPYGDGDAARRIGDFFEGITGAEFGERTSHRPLTEATRPVYAETLR